MYAKRPVINGQCWYRSHSIGALPDQSLLLLELLHQLMAHDNTIVVTGHNLDVFKPADRAGALSPKGDDGGVIIATGNRLRHSHTRRFLKPIPPAVRGRRRAAGRSAS